jgi:hypothetical protein
MVLKRQMLLANKKQESDASTLARESDGLPPNYAVPAFEKGTHMFPGKEESSERLFPSHFPIFH